MSDDDLDLPPGPPLHLVPNDDEEPNAPERIGTSPGVYKHVSKQEALARRQALTGLIFASHPIAEVHAFMARQFGMSEDAIELLETELYNKWMQEDKRRRPFLKQIRVRQLERAIVEARKGGAHGAAMKGAELLAKMEGTQAPIAVDVRATGEVEHLHTWARYLDEMPEDERRALIEAERARLPEGQPIEVEAVPVGALQGADDPAEP